MKTFSEGRALLIAIATSAVAIAGTFGFAALMRLPRSHLDLPTLPSTAQAAPSMPTMSAEATEGRHLFLMNCAHCHADDATGDEGPDLHDLHKSDERIHQLIINGVKGEMPSFAKKLNEVDVHALTAYLRTLHS
jgi:mono/diheme cytochrome c family protein